MEKQSYDLLYNPDAYPPKMNEPFMLMKAKEQLGKRKFGVVKLKQKQQNIHAHDYYQMWYILKGSCQHKIDNHSFKNSTGDLILIPPYSYHSMSNGSSDLIVIIVDFAEDFFSDSESDKQLMLQCITPLYLRQSEENSVFLADNNMENIILEMFNEFTVKKDFYNHIIKSNLIKLIVAIERSNDKKDVNTLEKERTVAKTLKYIHSNLSQKITLKDLCKNANISDTALMEHFKKATGKTIIEYVNHLKIDKAKQLLVETNLRVIDIACELGFGDETYFSRVFKKHINITPNAYRKQKRE